MILRISVTLLKTTEIKAINKFPKAAREGGFFVDKKMTQ